MADKGNREHASVLSPGAGVRCDKVDLLVRLEHDRFQQFYQDFEAFISACEDTGQTSIPFYHRTLTGENERGERTYSLETYGPGCDEVLAHLPAEWHQYLNRLDYRITTEIDDRKLSALAAYIEQNGKGGRNVSYFNTRPRQKLEGRHAGGKGVAVGSHKSNTRMAVYKRKGETGALEIQVTGEALQNTVATAKSLMQAGAFADWYQAVMAVLAGRLSAIATQAGFADVEHLRLFLQPDDRPEEQMQHDKATLDKMRAILDGLTASERKVLVAALGIRKKDVIQ